MPESSHQTSSRLLDPIIASPVANPINPKDNRGNMQ
jgi:hypothetical protein